MARQHSDWALEELGIRRVVWSARDHDTAAMAEAAETLGTDVRALRSLLASATELGRARDADAGLVAYREPGDRIVVLSAAAARSEGALWAGVAHELGNALTTIGGWATVASSTLDEKEARKAIAIVAESVREAMDVAPLLLEGVGAGESSEAARVVSGVVERYLPVAAARGITLAIGRLDDGEVVASRAAVAAITANLVKNAIEACKRGGRVEVGVRLMPRTMEIVVEDDGRGMPEPVRRSLFNARSTPREGKRPGRGVGLSVVNALVERTGGKARATSTVGAGSCVRVELPRLAKRARSSGIRRAVLRRVLLVEDHASIAELVETALVARGAEVFRTSDPNEALAEAREGPFDFALVDLDLGGSRGEALIEALKREQLAARVVVMSGAAVVEIAGVHGLLRKPFDISDLDELIEAAPTRRPPRSRGA